MKKESNINKNPKIVNSRVWGICGFVLAILAFVGLFLFGGGAGLIPGILGLIFCIIQFKKGKTRLAVAGLVLSIIGIVISIFNIISYYLVSNYVKSVLES